MGAQVMNIQRTVEKLIKSTIARAIRETAAGILVIFAFTYTLQHSLPGTARYYGCLLVLVSTAFVLGVIWSYTLSYHLLRTHPVTDSAFWRDAFAAQARLLRLFRSGISRRCVPAFCSCLHLHRVSFRPL